MAKIKTRWVCQSCAYESASYLGRCPDCGEFASFCEETILSASPLTAQNIVRSDDKIFAPSLINEIEVDETIRISTSFEEFDRVLGESPKRHGESPKRHGESPNRKGGGFVQGSLVLLAGDPGIGKSTLILQACKNICNNGKKTLYVCAEESVSQVKLRAQRLGVEAGNLYVTSQNCLEEVILQIEQLTPEFLVVDSIQAVYSSSITSSAGSVSQIRESANLLMKIAKQKNITTVVIGHVTKEGNIAGPKVLEHMVDCVINFEGDKYKTYRMLRSVKNRFGPTSEVGVFNMEDDGLKEITNPSEMFLREKDQSPTEGCTVIATIEGTRTLLLEVQALVGATPYPSPRRVARGVEYNRLLQILAVLEKRVGLNLSKQDVYINVIGGIDIIEPAADLGIAMAVLSCARSVVVDQHTVIIGEIGLSGEIRAVDNIEKRLREAEKLGFKTAVVPNVSDTVSKRLKDLNIKIVQVSRLVDAIPKCIGNKETVSSLS